ncbi:MAG: hypothetical protein HQL19_07585, partial [Candidatus Omnitrophica bacterium]|nr:hypothetical protein [Candidatus Omnitrophota bacterium]
DYYGNEKVEVSQSSEEVSRPPLRDGLYDGEVEGNFRWVQTKPEDVGHGVGDNGNFGPLDWEGASPAEGYWEKKVSADSAESGKNDGVTEPPLRDGAYHGAVVGNYLWVETKAAVTETRTRQVDYYYNNPGTVSEEYVVEIEPPEGYWQLKNATDSSQLLNGGIDINNIGVEKKSDGGKIQFNDAAMKAIFNGKFEGFTPVFIRMTPVESPLAVFK